MIIGITGTLGAGKGAAVERLKEKGFTHYSARAFITDEIRKRNLPVNRDTMTEVGNDLRREHGPAHVIESLLRIAEHSGGNNIIESIRTVGEVETLKLKGGILISINAEPRTRYERIVKRGSETDAVSFEEFTAHEERESISDDPAKQNLKRVAALADFHIRNDGNLEKLHRQVDAILATVERL
jgi:dephospho-CoA kinase